MALRPQHSEQGRAGGGTAWGQHGEPRCSLGLVLSCSTFQSTRSSEVSARDEAEIKFPEGLAKGGLPCEAQTSRLTSRRALGVGQNGRPGREQPAAASQAGSEAQCVRGGISSTKRH